MKKKIVLFTFMLLFPVLVHANTVINGNDFAVYNRTKEAIYNKWQTGKIDRSIKVFTSLPSYTAPYQAGVVTDEYLQELLDNLNYYRYLVGVPEITKSVSNDVELQTAEVIQTLYVLENSAVTHHLADDFTKPADMSEAFYNLGANATHDVISFGRTDEPNFYFFDESIFDENYPEAGHRMALLSPEIGGEDYGVGYYTIYGRSTNDRTNYSKMTNSFAAYPSPGYFPKEDFADTSDWDVFLNIDNFKFLTEEEQNNVVVTIKNLSNNKTYTRTKEAGNLNFNYKCEGTLCTIYNRLNILKPGKSGPYYEGSYEVTVTNLIDKQGNPVDLKYTVNFYDKYENHELAIENADFEFDLDTVMYDGEYNKNLLDNALEGIGLTLYLEDNLSVSYIPSSYQIDYNDTIGGMRHYYAAPILTNLPSYIIDPNNVLDTVYLDVYGCQNSSQYRFTYNSLVWKKNEQENVTISVDNFNADFAGEVMYIWVVEKNGTFYMLTDPDKYSTDGLNLNIANLTESDSGNYYLTALLMSDEYLSVYYLSKPLNLTVSKNYLKGDMNKNNKIDLADVILLLRGYLNDDIDEADIPIGDMDESGTIGLTDIIELLKLYLNT